MSETNVNIVFSEKGAQQIVTAIEQIQNNTKATLNAVEKLNKSLSNLNTRGAAGVNNQLKNMASSLDQLKKRYNLTDDAVKKFIPDLKRAEEYIRKKATTMTAAGRAGDVYYQKMNRVVVMEKMLSGQLNATRSSLGKTREELNRLSTAKTKVANTTATAAKGFRNLIPHVAAVTLSYMAMRRATQAVIASLKAGVEFEHQMAIVGGIVRATGKDLDMLTAAARKAGETTVWTATESAQALRYLGMAGFNAAESMTALPAVLNLALIGELDLGRATDIATDTLRAFGLQADELSRVVDVFTATITRSNTNVESMGQAMKYVAPVASQLGYSVEETAAMIGILSQSGIKAGIAGRALRMSFLKSIEAADQLSLSTINLLDILKELAKTVDSKQELATALKDMFGLRSAPAMMVLMENMEALEKFIDINEHAAGETDKFIERLKTTQVEFRLLKSVITDVAIEAFNQYSDTLKEVLISTRIYIKKHRDDLVGLVQQIKDTFAPIGGLIDIYSALGDVLESLGEVQENIREKLTPPTVNTSETVTALKNLTAEWENAYYTIDGMPIFPKITYFLRALADGLYDSADALRNFSNWIIGRKLFATEEELNKQSADWKSMLSDMEDTYQGFVDKQIAGEKMLLEQRQKTAYSMIEVYSLLDADTLSLDFVQRQKAIDDYMNSFKEKNKDMLESLIAADEAYGGELAKQWLKIETQKFTKQYDARIKNEEQLSRDTLKLKNKFLDEYENLNLTAYEKQIKDLEDARDRALAIEGISGEEKKKIIEVANAQILAIEEKSANEKLKTADKLKKELENELKILEKFNADKLKATQDLYNELEGISSVYYTAQIELIDQEYNEYIKALGLENIAYENMKAEEKALFDALNQWKKEKTYELYQELLINFGGFTGGMVAYFREAQHDWENFNSEFGQLGYDTFEKLGDGFEQTFSKVLKGDFDEIGDLWKSLLNDMLDSFIDMISKMIRTWLSAEFSKMFEGSFSVSSLTSGDNSGGGLLSGILSKAWGSVKNLFGMGIPTVAATTDFSGMAGLGAYEVAPGGSIIGDLFDKVWGGVKNLLGIGSASTVTAMSSAAYGSLGIGYVPGGVAAVAPAGAGAGMLGSLAGLAVPLLVPTIGKFLNKLVGGGPHNYPPFSSGAYSLEPSESGLFSVGQAHMRTSKDLDAQTIIDFESAKIDQTLSIFNSALGLLAEDSRETLKNAIDTEFKNFHLITGFDTGTGESWSLGAWGVTQTEGQYWAQPTAEGEVGGYASYPTLGFEHITGSGLDPKDFWFKLMGADMGIPDLDLSGVPEYGRQWISTQLYNLPKDQLETDVGQSIVNAMGDYVAPYLAEVMTNAMSSGVYEFMSEGVQEAISNIGDTDLFLTDFVKWSKGLAEALPQMHNATVVWDALQQHIASVENDISGVTGQITEQERLYQIATVTTEAYANQLQALTGVEITAEERTTMLEEEFAKLIEGMTGTELKETTDSLSALDVIAYQTKATFDVFREKLEECGVDMEKLNYLRDEEADLIRKQQQALIDLTEKTIAETIEGLYGLSSATQSEVKAVIDAFTEIFDTLKQIGMETAVYEQEQLDLIRYKMGMGSAGGYGRVEDITGKYGMGAQDIVTMFAGSSLEDLKALAESLGYADWTQIASDVAYLVDSFGELEVVTTSLADLIAEINGQLDKFNSDSMTDYQKAITEAETWRDAQLAALGAITQFEYDNQDMNIAQQIENVFGLMMSDIQTRFAETVDDIVWQIEIINGAYTEQEIAIHDLTEKFTQFYEEAENAGASAETLSWIMEQLDVAIANTATGLSELRKYITDLLSSVSSTFNPASASQLMAQIRALQAGPMNPENLTAISELLVQWYNAAISESEQRVNLQVEVTKALSSLIDQIDDTISRIKYSDLNIALPKVKAEEAGKDYAKLYAAAQTGGTAEIQEYLAFTSTYLQQAQAEYKSSQAYQDIYAQVMADMEGIKSKAEAGGYDAQILAELKEQRGTNEAYLGNIQAIFLSMEDWIMKQLDALENEQNILTINWAGFTGDAADIMEKLLFLVEKYDWDNEITLTWITNASQWVSEVETAKTLMEQIATESGGWDSTPTLTFIAELDMSHFDLESQLDLFGFSGSESGWTSTATLSLLANMIDNGGILWSDIESILSMSGTSQSIIMELQTFYNATKSDIPDWDALELFLRGYDITEPIIRKIHAQYSGDMPWADLETLLTSAGLPDSYIRKIQSSIVGNVAVQATFEEATLRWLNNLNSNLCAKLDNINTNMCAKLNTANGYLSKIAGATGMYAGDLVTSPTYSLIGERGPEAVIPLDHMAIPVQILNGGTNREGAMPPIKIVVEVAGKEFETDVKAWADEVRVTAHRTKNSEKRRLYT